MWSVKINCVADPIWTLRIRHSQGNIKESARASICFTIRFIETDERHFKCIRWWLEFKPWLSLLEKIWIEIIWNDSVLPVIRLHTGKHSKQSGSSLLPPSPCRWSQNGPHDESPGMRQRACYQMTHRCAECIQTVYVKCQCVKPASRRRFLWNSSLWQLF